MTKEQKTWHLLKQSVGNHWHATRHEDLLGQGVPDVSWGARGQQGWVELKALESWPVRPGTVVRIPHYTAEQKLFLLNRGIGCWLLLRVDLDWLLFRYDSAQGVGSWTKKDLYRWATRTWNRVPPGKEFVDALTGQGKIGPGQGGR